MYMGFLTDQHPTGGKNRVLNLKSTLIKDISRQQLQQNDKNEQIFAIAGFEWWCFYFFYFSLLISMKRKCFSALHLSSLGHSQLMHSSLKSKKTLVDDTILVDPCVIHAGPVRDARHGQPDTKMADLTPS